MMIVGTLTSLGVSNVPVNVQLGLALKIMVEPGESGMKSLTIRFLILVAVLIISICSTA